MAELERLGDEIAELSAHLDAATARLLTLIREFHAHGGWNTGFRSCAHWLSWRIGMDLGAARERVRVARALGGLPGLAGALAQGELSYAKVRALTRVATPETRQRSFPLEPSNRRTRWCSWPRRRCTRSWIPEHRESDTRLWSTWTRRHWRTPSSPANPC
jgi:uncharacterized protein DUF222